MATNSNAAVTLTQFNSYCIKLKTYVEQKDGTLFALETNNKSNLVAAINEVAAAVEEASEKVGFELALEGDSYVAVTSTELVENETITYYRKAKSGETPTGEHLSSALALENLTLITENNLFADTIYGKLYRVLSNYEDLNTLDVSTTNNDDSLIGKYTLSQGGRQVGVIDVPKDMVLQQTKIINALSQQDFEDKVESTNETTVDPETSEEITTNANLSADGAEYTENGVIYEEEVSGSTEADKKYLKLIIANGENVYIDIEDFGESVVPLDTFDDNTGKIGLSFVERSGVRYLEGSLLANSIGTAQLADGAVTEAKLETALVTLINTGITNYNAIGAWSNTVGTALTVGEISTLENQLNAKIEAAETLQEELDGLDTEDPEDAARIAEIEGLLATNSGEQATINAQLQGLRYDVYKEGLKHAKKTVTDDNSGEETQVYMTVAEEIAEGVDNMPLATSLNDGLMSKEDKTKLDGISYDAETMTITAPDGNGNMVTFSIATANDSDIDDLFGDDSSNTP